MKDEFRKSIGKNESRINDINQNIRITELNFT